MNSQFSNFFLRIKYPSNTRNRTAFSSSTQQCIFLHALNISTTKNWVLNKRLHDSCEQLSHYEINGSGSKKISQISLLVVTTISALLALLGGCSTQLETHQENAGRYTSLTNGARAEIGAVYGLPMLQFQLQVQRTLLQCEESGEVKIRFLTKVESQPSYVVGERFTLDYETLAGWSKTSALELQTYDSGVIKSLNAEVSDQTKGIVGNVVKSGISLVSLAQGIPLAATNAAPLPPGPKPLGYTCTAPAKSALDLIDSTTKALKAETKQLVELTDEVTRLERLAGLNALTDDAKDALDVAQKAAATKAKRVTELDKELASFIDRISVKEQIVWPQAASERTLDAAPNSANKSKLEKLFEQAPGGYSQAAWNGTMSLRARLAPVTATPPIVSCVKDDSNCLAKEIKPRDAVGLFYRTPVPARLLICEVATDNECDLGIAGTAIHGASNVIVSTSVMAPQLGPLNILPYSNGAFQNNVLKVAFRESGSIASLNYDEKSARGADLTASISSGLDQLVAFRDKKQAEKDKQAAAEKAEDDAKKKADLNELDDEIARLEKVKKISTLNAEASQSATLADMESETARLNAQLAVLEAKRKVRDAEALLDHEDEP